MSKYTTEVRYICEVYSGLSESVGYDKIDEVLNDSWDKVFDFDFPIFDDNYRKALCIKILKHFYTREIGEETVGLWKLRLNTRMNEIMPYYNQLYESETLKINPLYTFNYQKTHKDSGGDVRTIEETGTNSESIEGTNGGTRSTTENSTINSTDSGQDVINGDTSTGNTTQGKTETAINGNVISNKTETLKDRYSDTPQGGLTGIENNTYLTNARLNDNSISQTDTNKGNEQSVNNEVVTGQSNSNQTTSYGKINNNVKNATGSITDAFTNKSNRSGESGKNVSDSVTTTREYIESVMGSNGVSDSELLMEYRETFLNIDVAVINELNDLFMNIW